MKVIVNDQTPLTVEDVHGNVLYQWNPEKKYTNMTELKMKPLSDEERKIVLEQLRNKMFNENK